MAINTQSFIWTIKELANLIGNTIQKTKVWLDLSFQSIFRWDKAKQEKYLKCTLEGFATSPIVLADIQKCAINAKGDKESLEYFQNLLKEDYLYIIIDGNNRMTTINDFFNDKVGLPIGTYTNLYNKDVKYTVTGNKGQHAVKFSNLETRLQDYLNAFLLNMTIVEKVSRRELSMYFDALNDGVKLNAQEIRNSWFSEFAEQVREAGSEFSDIFDKKVSQMKVKRRQHDEVIAYLATSCQSEQLSVDIKSKTVDAAYGRNIDYRTPASANSVAWRAYLDRTMDTISYFSDGSITKSTVVDIFNFIWQHSDLYIKDYKTFAEYMAEVVEFCKNDKKDILLEDNTGSFPYSGMLRQAYTASYMKLRLGKLVKTFWSLNPKIAESVMTTSEEHEGVIKDKQRIYTPSQRFQIWLKQDKKDIHGDDIPLAEINDSTKWQADHIVEWSKGGLTTVENGQLLSVEDHMKKTVDYNRKRQNEELAKKREEMANPVSAQLF